MEKGLKIVPVLFFTLLSLAMDKTVLTVQFLIRLSLQKIYDYRTNCSEHIQSMQDNRLTKQILYYKPRDRRCDKSSLKKDRMRNWNRFYYLLQKVKKIIYRF